MSELQVFSVSVLQVFSVSVFHAFHAFVFQVFSVSVFHVFSVSMLQVFSVSVFQVFSVSVFHVFSLFLLHPLFVLLFSSNFKSCNCCIFTFGILIFHAIALSSTFKTSEYNLGFSCICSISCCLSCLFCSRLSFANQCQATIHVVNVVTSAVAAKFLGFQSASSFSVPSPFICHKSNWSFARILIRFHVDNCRASWKFSSRTSDHTFFKNIFHKDFRLFLDSHFNISFIYDLARFFHDHNKNSFGLTNSSHHCIHAFTRQ